MPRSAYDCAHVKSVAVIAILHPDSPNGVAGKIVANYSDNPNGSVCTASVHIFHGPLADLPACHGRAGGYGYDKLSAAVCSAVRDGLTKIKSVAVCLDSVRSVPLPTFNGAGFSGIAEWFEPYGYTLVALVGGY